MCVCVCVCVCFIGLSSFSVIFLSNSMNSLNWVHSDVFIKSTDHHKIKCKVLHINKLKL